MRDTWQRLLSPLAEMVGFEPTNTGVKVLCLNRLATSLYGGG